jgi:hypothetical protein
MRFSTSGFFHEALSPNPLSIPLGRFKFFFKFMEIHIHSYMCTTGVSVVVTGGKWKKSSIKKVLTILFGHLWLVQLIYR